MYLAQAQPDFRLTENFLSLISNKVCFLLIFNIEAHLLCKTQGCIWLRLSLISGSQKIF